jgi:hypothetical protein
VVVLVDRGIGLLGLVLVAAVGATLAVGARADGTSSIWPSWLWAGFLLGTAASPGAFAACFGGAVVVQALLVLYYLAVVYALHLPIGLWDLSVIVPVSFLVQMLPVSMNGFGVREAAFSFYFTRLGLPIESAMLLPLVATALIIVFSLSGAAVYVARGSRPGLDAACDVGLDAEARARP